MELNKRQELERELAKLLSEWAPDSRTLVPDVEHGTSISLCAKLDQIIEEGWDKVDNLVKRYESFLGVYPDIEEVYPRHRVYEAGVLCCDDLNARWDKIYTEVKIKKLLTRNQIDVMDSYVAKEKAEYQRRLA